MYQLLGYIESVSRAAEKCMQDAVEEVKSLPHYSEKGEVRSDHYMLTGLCGMCYKISSLRSLMPDMTQQPMHSIPLFRVYLEGIANY